MVTISNKTITYRVVNDTPIRHIVLVFKSKRRVLTETKTLDIEEYTSTDVVVSDSQADRIVFVVQEYGNEPYFCILREIDPFLERSDLIHISIFHRIENCFQGIYLPV